MQKSEIDLTAELRNPPSPLPVVTQQRRGCLEGKPARSGAGLLRFKFQLLYL